MAIIKKKSNSNTPLVRKMQNGGPTDPLTQGNLTYEQRRAQRILELSRQWNVPTNQIYSSVKYRQSGFTPKPGQDVNQDLIDYQSFYTIDPSTGKPGLSQRDYSSPVGISYFTPEDIELQRKNPGKGARVISQNNIDKSKSLARGTVMPEMKQGGIIKKKDLKIMADGGPIDPTDPDFANKLQQLLIDNPDLASDYFNTSIPSPSQGEQIGLEPNNNLTWQDTNNPLPINNPVGTSVDSNTNAQQKNSTWKNKSVNIPVGDAVKGLVMGANYLATEYIDNPRKRANEMRLLRRQLTGVTSKPSQGGYDMPVLAKSGIKITSAYTNNHDVPNYNKTPKNPWGNVADQYKVDDPAFANVLVEGGEFLELPDGQTSTITGDKHSDYSGGELMNLPNESKVYSDSIKVDKEFAKDLTGSKSSKKKTVAQIAKKYKTDPEVGVLKDPTSDPIAKRTANIMKTYKESQLQQLFDYQESVKDPMYMIAKEQGAEDFMGSEDTVVAKNGVKVMQDGGKTKKKNFVSPTSQRTFSIIDGKVVQNLSEVNITGKKRELTPQESLDRARATIKKYREIDGSSAPNEDTISVQQNPWWMNLGQGNNSEVDMGKNIPRQLTQPVSTPRLTTPDSTPDLVPPVSTPNWNPQDLDPIRGKYVMDTLPLGVTPPQLQPLDPPTTIQPGDTPIDPNKPKKPIPDNNKVLPPQPSPKVPWGNALEGFGEITPELFAMIQNQSDFPIFTAKYQPKYLNPVEMNIQASLNRNYAQTQPLLQSTGNPAIDNARSAQAIANLYDANNEMFQQKFNFDTQNRYQTDATNLQIENEANRYNLQRADDFWNKVTARQAVKETTNNNIINSAYAKFKRKQLENRSLQLTNQMFDNYKYDPSTGIYFDNRGQQFVFHEPTQSLVNIGGSVGDGVETTRTTRTSPRGTTQTIRQKEKKGS